MDRPLRPLLRLAVAGKLRGRRARNAGLSAARIPRQTAGGTQRGTQNTGLSEGAVACGGFYAQSLVIPFVITRYTQSGWNYDGASDPQQRSSSQATATTAHVPSSAAAGHYYSVSVADVCKTSRKAPPFRRPYCGMPRRGNETCPVPLSFPFHVCNALVCHDTTPRGRHGRVPSTRAQGLLGQWLLPG